MLATFPNMGNMHIVLQSLFENLNIKVMTPPPITTTTLNLGVKYAPETVCIPFKIMLGSFIEALEQGADTIVTCGGVGPCRLGYYAAVQKEILADMGFKFEMVVIEPDVLSVMKALGHLSGKSSWREMYQAFCLAGAKMSALDDIEQVVHRVRPREKSIGTSDCIWQQAIRCIGKQRNIDEIVAYSAQCREKLDAVEIKPGYRPLDIGIIGEIFVMLEPFINQDIVRRLGNMGVEVHKTMFLTDYVRTHLLRKKQYYNLYEDIINLAKPYLGHYVGGHGIKSIGATVQMGQAGFDGMIHMFPFSCMPEVIAKNILPQVSRDADIPVLSLAFDEQSGEAGIVTRLEAFIDLLKYRQVKKEKYAN